MQTLEMDPLFQMETIVIDRYGELEKLQWKHS